MLKLLKENKFVINASHCSHFGSTPTNGTNNNSSSLKFKLKSKSIKLLQQVFQLGLKANFFY